MHRLVPGREVWDSITTRTTALLRGAVLCCAPLLGCAAAPRAPTAREQARKALSTFLQMDYQGEVGARYSHALMTHTDVDAAPDIHVLDVDASDLDVIRSFEIGDFHAGATKHCADVRFQRVASARGRGAYDRRIEAAELEELQRYCVRETEEGWQAIDPGLPRVEADALRRLPQERIAFMDDIRRMSELGASQQRYRQSLERQLLELGELRQ